MGAAWQLGPLMAEGRSLALRDAEGREYRVELDGSSVVVNGAAVRVKPAGDGAVRVGAARVVTAWTVAVGGTRWVFLDGEVFTFTAAAPGARRSQGADASLAAPMPATVRQIAVQPGATVCRGDVLVVLEAMKMELPVRAPADGTIAAVKCHVGEMVQAGQQLIELTA